MCKELLVHNNGKIHEILIAFIYFSKILQWRSLRKYMRQYIFFLSKPSSIPVIKVEVYRRARKSEDAETRRKKEMPSRIHHNAVTKASADDTF